jgi:hypothetical protein
LAPRFNVKLSEEVTVAGTFKAKGEAEAKCAAGEQVVSGGVSNNPTLPSPGFSLAESAPEPEKKPPGWKVVMAQTASGSLGTKPPKIASFQAFAICTP